MDGFLYDLSVEQSQSNNQDFTVQEWKRSIFIPIPKKGNANVQTIAQLAHFTG